MGHSPFSHIKTIANRTQRRADDLPFAVFEQALIDRLSDIKREDFDHAVWLGYGDSSVLRRIKNITTLDVRLECVEGEMEAFPYAPESLDLIVCYACLHTVNDLPGALVQMRRALKPDGLFLCALPGGETLYELRDSLVRVETVAFGGAAPRVHPMIDLQTFSGLMQRAGFALPVVDADIQTIYYRALKTLLRDIKASGEGLALAAHDKRFLGSRFWDAVEADYKSTHASTDGLLMASFEVLYGIGWAPADTQPKPLKPGSAKNRLADALGATEGQLPR